MTTPPPVTPPPSEPPADLTFVAHDLGRTEEVDEVTPTAPLAFDRGGAAAPASPARFHVVGATPQAPARPAADDLLWTPRDGAARPEPRAADSPWTVRRTDQLARVSETTVRRLRQEAVNLSWTAAWLAIGAAGPARRRRR